MKTIRIILSIAMIIIMVGCERQQTPVAAPQVVEPAPLAVEPAPEQTAFKQVKKNKIKPFEVMLKVGTGSTPGTWTLDNMNNKNPNCTKFPDEDKYRKGCIDAQLNEMVNVNFSLIGSKDWYFAEFQICAAPALAKPDDFESCKLTEEQVGEWIIVAGGKAAIPNTDGLVDISALGMGLDAFTLIDVNLTAANYFYRVCVKNANNDIACSDPAAENYGNN